MANLTPRSFSAIVQTIAAGAQGRAKVVLDYSIGSTLRAMAEGHAGVALWLQGLILKLLLTTRAATSSGADLDSFYADFNFPRLAANPSSGLVQFSRFTPSGSTPFIQVGTTVQTADGSQIFSVAADTTNPIFSPSLNGYTMPAMVGAISLPVLALTSGVASNVAAGAITTLTTPIIGIDAVTNLSAFANGSDGESDPAYRLRFVAYIAALSKATIAAVIYTVQSFKLGMQATVLENVNADGSSHQGFITVTVDDGSGYPPSDLVTAVGAAVGNVRAGGVYWGVYAPAVVLVDIVFSITTAAGYDHNTEIALAVAAVTSYVNSLPLGTNLAYTQVARIAYDASPGITNVTGVTVNLGTVDVVVTKRNVIKINTLVVT